jgi:transposase-like protein
MDAETTPPTTELLEIKELRRQLKEVEQERDILKKALAIFSRKV